MSYDLEQLGADGGLQVASIRFSSGTDLAGTIFIATQTGGQAVIHQIFFQASAYFPIQIERATGAASAYWSAFGNQTGIFEPVRFLIDSGSACFLEGTSGLGSGLIRAYYTVRKGAGLSL